MQEILSGFAPLMLAVWAATEGLHRAFGKKQNPWVIALVLGQIAALAGWQSGFITLHGGDGPWSWVWCAVLGVLSSMAAGLANDWAKKWTKKHQ